MRTFLVLLVLAAIWALAIVDIISSLTYWVTVFGVPLVMMIFYYRWYARGRKKFFLAALDKYWWIWLPTVVLASVITVVVALRGSMGVYVPYLNWGLRDTPWGFVYFFQLLMWAGVMVVIGCYSNRFRQKLGRYYYLWVQHGGFWKIGSTDNWPAHTVLIVYVAFVYLAVLQGFPTPDLEMAAYEVDVKAQQALTSELGQSVQSVKAQIISVKAQIIDWGEALIGKDIFDTAAAPVVEPLVHPGLRFEKSWFWVKGSLLFAPIVLFALVMSYRDEAAALVASLLTALRREDLSSGEAASSARQQKSGPEDSPQDSGGGGSSFSKEVIKEVGAQEATKVMYALLRQGATFFKRLGSRKIRP